MQTELNLYLNFKKKKIFIKVKIMSFVLLRNRPVTVLGLSLQAVTVFQPTLHIVTDRYLTVTHRYSSFFHSYLSLLHRF